MARGRNEGLNFGNVVAGSEGTENGDPGGVGGSWRKLDCWHCGGEHLKINCPKCAEEKEKTKKYDGGEWRAQGSNDKRADGETEVKGGQLHTMFKSLVYHTWGQTSVSWERTTNSPGNSSTSRDGERKTLRDTHRWPCKTPPVVQFPSHGSSSTASQQWT